MILVERIVYCVLVDGASMEVSFVDHSPEARIAGRVELSKAEMNQRIDALMAKLKEQVNRRLGP